MTVAQEHKTDKHRLPQVEQAILDAARDLLASGGHDGLSMRLVADQTTGVEKSMKASVDDHQ